MNCKNQYLNEKLKKMREDFQNKTFEHIEKEFKTINSSIETPHGSIFFRENPKIKDDCVYIIDHNVRKIFQKNKKSTIDFRNESENDLK